MSIRPIGYVDMVNYTPTPSPPVYEFVVNALRQWRILGAPNEQREAEQLEQWVSQFYEERGEHMNAAAAKGAGVAARGEEVSK